MEFITKNTVATTGSARIMLSMIRTKISGMFREMKRL